jgi:hypothetical protein
MSLLQAGKRCGHVTIVIYTSYTRHIYRHIRRMAQQVHEYGYGLAESLVFFGPSYWNVEISYGITFWKC